MGALFGTKASAGTTATSNKGGGGSAQSSSTAGTTGGTASGGAVDVSEVLEKEVVAKNQKLNWRTSIVDLMKALDLDSSLAARKELAKELNYTGSTDDTATMNMWLHKQVMAKLAANGGKVPDDLKN